MIKKDVFKHIVAIRTAKNNRYNQWNRILY